MKSSPGKSDSNFEVPPEKRPRHIAAIMDGNGRWAQRRGLPRIEGHRHGVAAVRRTVEECVRLGIEYLTLYCLSSENWKRPKSELDFLLRLLEQYIVEERQTFLENNVRVVVIGKREGIPSHVQREIDKTVEMTADQTGLCLCLAVNYGGRAEILDAVRAIAAKVAEGQLSPNDIDEATFSAHLYTAGMPDPDLLIRTAGELRVSNFLLWQISYAELWVTDVCWPDFDENLLRQAIRDYARRVRRFGGLAVSPS
ncbi:MAG: isoprenyl transferase [Thermogutta sp.]|jgi:undecaprenyl diphosphate synthase|uniref:isoprenyl transferase n=1 Tax=Thermogutta terrifontis TaxID=1331910 RepID=UPI000BA87520|nr:isoprenyl transferase [Thermogutta terrifontis]